MSYQDKIENAVGQLHRAVAQVVQASQSLSGEQRRQVLAQLGHRLLVDAGEQDLATSPVALD